MLSTKFTQSLTRSHTLTTFIIATSSWHLYRSLEYSTRFLFYFPSNVRLAGIKHDLMLLPFQEEYECSGYFIYAWMPFKSGNISQILCCVTSRGICGGTHPRSMCQIHASEQHKISHLEQIALKWNICAWRKSTAILNVDYSSCQGANMSREQRLCHRWTGIVQYLTYILQTASQT